MALKQLIPELKIYGYDDRIPGITDKLNDGDSFNFGKLRIEAIHCPCHTTGSLSYVIHDDDSEPSAQAAFTGDTLFLGGCGRFFEGNAAQMYHILYERLSKLPPNITLFVGHEYTIKNLQVSMHTWSLRLSV